MKLGPCLCNPIHTGPISFSFHYFIRAAVIASLPLKLTGTLSAGRFPGSWSKRSNRSVTPQFVRLAHFLSVFPWCLVRALEMAHMCVTSAVWSATLTSQMLGNFVNSMTHVWNKRKSFIFQVVFLENLDVYNLNLYLYLLFCLSTYRPTYREKYIKPK